MSKANGVLQRVETKNWNGRDKISFNLNGAWYGAYLDQMDSNAQQYVKTFKPGDEVEIEYEQKTKSDGGTYNVLAGILKIDRPEGSPAPVQPVGHLIAKPKWQGGAREPKENPDYKVRSMAFSYVKDLYISKGIEAMCGEFGIDYDAMIEEARKVEKYIKEG